MAHPSQDNFCEIEGAEDKAFIPFKSGTTGAIGGLFQKAFHYFNLHREEFMARYHQRSNVESTFSMIKAKFGDNVRAKTDTAMGNEVLAKIVLPQYLLLDFRRVRTGDYPGIRPSGVECRGAY